MALQLTDAIVDGSRRVLTRSGGILFALLLVHQTLLVTSLNTLIAAEIPPAADAIGLTLPVSGPVAGAVLVVALVLNATYFVVLARAFARPLSALSSFPADLYTRRIGRATLTMFVSGALVWLATMLGLPFLLVPGLFIAASFICVIFAVGVEDRGVVGAVKRSWALARGNRLRLMALVFAVAVAGAVVGFVPSVLQMAGEAALSDLANIGLNSVLFVFVYGIVAAAYLQLADEDDGRGGADAATAAGTGHTPEL
ncbi:hypothetical protein [Haloplanus sp. C73]|uniref:hypothetical protein n=1 Tax=Haloplanus sp. C73 TaxID=3421641 RepID=UPI003EBA683A